MNFVCRAFFFCSSHEAARESYGQWITVTGQKRVGVIGLVQLISLDCFKEFNSTWSWLASEESRKDKITPYWCGKVLSDLALTKTPSPSLSVGNPKSYRVQTFASQGLSSRLASGYDPMVPNHQRKLDVGHSDLRGTTSMLVFSDPFKKAVGAALYRKGNTAVSV